MNVIYKCKKLNKTLKGGLNKTLRNGLMGKLPMKLKIVINYLKSLKNQNCTLTKIFIMQQDIK